MFEFFPTHTFDSFDIVVPGYSSAQTIEFNSTTISVQGESILPNSVCLLGAGTGFMCCKFHNDFRFKGRRTNSDSWGLHVRCLYKKIRFDNSN
jgi:hypothetical protein